MSQCQMCGREIPEGQQLCPTCRNAWEWRRRQQAQAAGGSQAGPGPAKSPDAAKASKPERPAKPPKPPKPPKSPKTAAAKAPQPGRGAALILGAALVAFLLFFGAALLFGGRATGQEGVQTTLDTWQEESADTQTADPGPEQIVAEAPEQMLPQQPPEGQQSLEGQQEAESGEYIFPDSDSAYLTREQVAALTPEQLRLARNEIYARHGRIFQDEALAAYFGSKSWYQPLYDGESFDALGDSILNEYEIANRDLIQEYEALYNGQ